MLKDPQQQQSRNKQRRLAVRNVVAHCWLPDFSLTVDGRPTGSLRVYHRNKNPKDNRAANLVLLTEEEANTQGLALTYVWTF